MDAITSGVGWSRVCTVCLALAAGAPFAGSLLAHSVGPAAPAATFAAERPALVFQQYLVNLREIPPLAEVSARFAFTNAGRAPVQVTALEPSCGCLDPRLDKRAYAPGESGEFLVRVQTATETPGPREYSVLVRYTDPEPRETRLLFKVTLPERQVQVEPRGLIFYDLGAGAGTTTERDVVVTDYRARTLRVERVEVSNPLATARIAGTTSEPGGPERTRIVVTVPARIPLGTHRGLLTIHTSDPAFPRLHVPIVIERRASLAGGVEHESH